jgi:hypothetical protein
VRNKALKYIVEREDIRPLVICLNQTRLPSWFVDVIIYLANAYVNFEIFIVVNKPSTSSRTSNMIIDLLVFIERFVFRQKFNGFIPVDVYKAFKGVNTVQVFDASKSNGNVPGSEDFVSIDFTGGRTKEQKYIIYPSNILEFGNVGIIQFVKHFLLAQKPLELTLNGKVVWQHWFQTQEYSIDKNIGFFKAAVKQSIESLWLSQREAEYEATENELVGWWQLICFFVNTYFFRLKKLLKVYLGLKRWFVVIRNKEQKKKILMPKGKDGWADPFIINDKYLFVEQVNADSGKGKLVLAQLDSECNIVEYKTIINEPFHLSYPNVLTINGKWYMIPESAEDKSLRLYEATEFPVKWKYLRNLQYHVRFYDFTPFFHNGLWWMFACSKEMERGSSFDQLYLFYSEDFINTTWKPHVMNPIITDSSSARMAGNLFWRNGELYRPSQDCFVRYGGRIKLNKVIKLSITEYEEELTEIVSSADIGLTAKVMHTINDNDTTTVFDIQKWQMKIFS